MITYRSSSGLSEPSVANSTSVVRTTRSPRLTFTGFTKMAMFPETTEEKTFKGYRDNACFW